MKRYWKSIGLTGFIVGVILFSYIQSSFAMNNTPNLSIENTSGDKNIGDRLVIEGDYSGGNHFEEVTITKDGTQFKSEDSYFKRLMDFDRNPNLKQLKTDYKSFMRSKNNDPDLYYEDDETLAYAEIESEDFYDGYPLVTSSLDIALFDKNKRKGTSFQLDLPRTNHLTFRDVTGVYLNGNELSVVANLSFYNNETNIDYEEYHVFKIDVDKRKIINEEKILTNEYNSEQEIEEWKELDFFPHGVSHANHNYFIFMEITQKQVMQEDDTVEYLHDNDNNKYIIYDIKTDKYKKLDIPASEKHSLYQESLHLDGDSLYITRIDDAEVKIMTYNIPNQKIDQEKKYKLSQGLQEEALTVIDEGKLIVTDIHTNKEVQSQLTVFDLDSADKLYEGKIEVGENGLKQEYLDMTIDSIKFRE